MAPHLIAAEAISERASTSASFSSKSAMAQCHNLEIERLKLQLEKARRARFGQSSERGRQIVEQLELVSSGRRSQTVS